MNKKLVRQCVGYLLLMILLAGCTKETMPTAVPNLNTIPPPPTPIILGSEENTEKPPTATPAPQNSDTQNKESLNTEQQPAENTEETLPSSDENATETQEDSPTPQPTLCATRSGWVNYIVQNNDTLYSIANRAGMTVAEIQQANCLEGTLIFAGQLLVLVRVPIPAPTLNSSPVEEPEPVTPSAPTPTPTATPDVEFPDAPGPGNPQLSITPFSGSYGVTHTIEITEFKPNESVTVTIYPLGESTNIIFSTTLAVDAEGNGVVLFTSNETMTVGVYTIQAIGNTGSEADGNLQITE